MSLEFKCECCGKTIKNIISEQALLTEDNNYICPTCAGNYYTTCNSMGCGRAIRTTHHRNVCKCCDEEVYKKNMNNYSCKPIPRFKNKSTDKRINLNNRYYGLELEVNNLKPNYARLLFRDLYNDKLIYNKSDGSISSGVEIVTSPCDRPSINKLLDNMREGFKQIEESKIDYSSNAGVHIHITRKSLSPIDIMKLSLLLNGTDRLNDKRYIYFLSGRISDVDTVGFSDSYYRMGSLSSGNMKVFKTSINGTADRHIALNLDNKSTIEFRLFKIHSNIEVIKSYIDLVDLMCGFVNVTGIKDISINNFRKYLLSNANNKILLEKDKVFSEKYTLTDVKYFVSEQEIWDLLKGVSYTKYKDIWNSLGGIGIHNNKYLYAEIKDVITHGVRVRTGGYYGGDTRKSNTILTKLRDTYKRVMINKIMKGVNKCA